MLVLLSSRYVMNRCVTVVDVDSIDHQRVLSLLCGGEMIIMMRLSMAAGPRWRQNQCTV